MTVRILRHGQITIPKEVRAQLGLADDDLLSVSVSPEGVLLKQVRPVPVTGSPWAKQLYDMFAPVRKSLEAYPSEEIDAAIDDALRAYRAELP